MALIEFSQNGFIGVISLNRPERLNSLNRQMLTELSEVLDALDPSVRCLILASNSEKVFCAGADISEMKDMDEAQALEFSLYGNSVMRKLEHAGVPVIAQINGHALGGGLELALACDIRIASQSAVMALPEVTLGILPGFGGTYRLPRLIGDAAAKEMIFTGARTDVFRAKEIGLISNFTAAPELERSVSALAALIAANGPRGVSGAKAVINSALTAQEEAAISAEAETFSKCFNTKDRKAAMESMLNKTEKPPFTGE